MTYRQKVWIMLAIMAAMLFAALNQTVVGTALPRIIAVLGGMEYYSWVFTIYMLASSVTVILVGKFSDMYGRKPFILLGLGFFLIGSFLCGLSQDIFQLIAYRSLQGIGGGMIMSTAMTAVGDIFTPREQGRWQGLMVSVFGLASIVGPAMGGYIVDYLDWHWVFWVNLPVGFLAILMIVFLFPKAQRDGKRQAVDFLGSLFLVVALLPMLLAFSWAGTVYPWDSLQVMGLFAVSLTGILLFVVAELRAENPVLPLNLFRNRIFTICNLIGFATGVGMFGTIMYIPLFLQGVLGTNATQAGMIMIPMTLAMMAASTLSGQLTSHTGKYKVLAVSGLFIMSLGMFLLTLMGTQTSNLTVLVNMILVGFGLGIIMPIFVLAVQNAFPNSVLGVVTSSTQLFRQMGGTIGVAVMGAVMSHRTVVELEANLTGEARSLVGEEQDLSNPQALLDPKTLETIRQSIPAQQLDVLNQVLQVLREVLASALHGVFLIGLIVTAFAFLLSFALKEIPLRGEIYRRRRKTSHTE